MKKFSGFVISIFLLISLPSCGGSGDCWAKRQALSAEIESIAALDDRTFYNVYKEPDWWSYGATNIEAQKGYIVKRIRAQMPTCD